MHAISSSLRLSVSGFALSTLAACASFNGQPPAPLDAAGIAQQVRADGAAARKDVPPLAGALTLDEAIARALKYNLDRRARQMEEAFALRQFEEVGYDGLPKLLASAGYTARDRERVARSIDSVTGEPSLANPAISQDKAHSTLGLTLTWSLLDYGLARYSAEQAGDRLHAAGERRRKATHLLVQDVRVAWWRAASAQRLRGEVKAALTLADEALADARKAENERLRTPLDSLRYQRQLTENMRLLESIEQELATARYELAALINAPVVQNLAVDADERPGVGDLLALPTEELEMRALANNADLREQLYQRRIAATEARKVVARAYPNLTLSIGAQHDSDSYLVHPTWAEAGAQLGMNLFNLLALPAQKRTAQAAIDLADQRRLAAHVAVLAQVHVAREQLLGAQRQFERADSLWQLDSRILEQTSKREQANAGSKLDRVAAQTSAIVSVLRRDQAMAQWHAAASRMLATLGVDPLPVSSDDLSLDDLRQQVRARLLQPAGAAK